VFAPSDWHGGDHAAVRRRLAWGANVARRASGRGTPSAKEPRQRALIAECTAPRAKHRAVTVLSLVRACLAPKLASPIKMRSPISCSCLALVSCGALQCSASISSGKSSAAINLAFNSGANIRLGRSSPTSIVQPLRSSSRSTARRTLQSKRATTIAFATRRSHPWARA